MNILQVHQEIDPYLEIQRKDNLHKVVEDFASFAKRMTKPVWEVSHHDFETTIGKTEFSVWGEYSAEDKSTGYAGQYDIYKVCVSTDLAGNDIQEYLLPIIIQSLEHSGMMYHIELGR